MCLKDYSRKLGTLGGASLSDSHVTLPEAQVISHMQTCIATALERYQAWQNRRSKT